jgi:hypothetical protein
LFDPTSKQAFSIHFMIVLECYKPRIIMKKNRSKLRKVVVLTPVTTNAQHRNQQGLKCWIKVSHGSCGNE